jgi:plasmid stability protein
MPSLLIRNVDAALHARLKERAAADRRSLEEEVRDLLRAATIRQPRE